MSLSQRKGPNAEHQPSLGGPLMLLWLHLSRFCTLMERSAYERLKFAEAEGIYISP